MCVTGTKEEMDTQCKFANDNGGKCKACQEDNCNTPEKSDKNEEEEE